MQAKADIGDAKNLYEFWEDLLYRSVIDDSRIIINLASKEYSKCIEKYLISKDRYITITFCEMSGDKMVTKGTYAKMARGEMVRFIAENNIENPAEIQKFRLTDTLSHCSPSHYKNPFLLRYPAVDPAAPTSAFPIYHKIGRAHV